MPVFTYRALVEEPEPLSKSSTFRAGNRRCGEVTNIPKLFPLCLSRRTCCLLLGLTRISERRTAHPQ
jgi:hypothetical protein